MASNYNVTEERRYPVHILKSAKTGLQYVAALIQKTVKKDVVLAEACSVEEAKSILGDNMIDTSEAGCVWGSKIPRQLHVPAERSWVEHVAESNRAGRNIRLFYCVGMSIQTQYESLREKISEPFKYFDGHANVVDGSLSINPYTQSRPSGYWFIDCSLEIPRSAVEPYKTFTKRMLCKAGAADVHIVAECVRLLHVCRGTTLLTEQFHVGLEKKSLVRIGNYDVNKNTLTLLRFKNIVSKTNTGYFRVIRPGEQLLPVPETSTLPPPA
ncbi:MAG TPA: hypothetical protein PLF31_03540 [Candidatus Paceibacterota bacterium]|nr:hypothetical protein [Candidatus Paceibacterota bacterium]